MAQQRPIVYSLQQILSSDMLGGMVDMAQGDANAMQVLLGNNGTYISNLVVTPTSPASLTLNISNGFIAQLAPTDASSYGSLPANTAQILQLGANLVTSVAISNEGLSVGQAQYVLIEAGFQQQDSNPVVLPYVNLSNPSDPLAGPGNSGLAQDTVRNAVANIVVKYGTPATAGMEVPPAPDAGYVPVALIDLAYGQVTITSGEILNPNDVAGSAASPVLAGLLNSHHGGIVGQAPKILLTNGDEVQGELPMANLVASNTVGAVSAFRLSTFGNPNGHYAGNSNVNGAADMIYDPLHNILYFCTTAGNTSTTVWTPQTVTPNITWNMQLFTASGTYTPTANTKQVFVAAVGGGGSGAVETSPVAGGGGSGGGGGGCAIGMAPITGISTPVTVTIGAGGAASSTTTGHPGGNTSFGSYLTGNGGDGGKQFGGVNGGGGTVSTMQGFVIYGGASNGDYDSGGPGGSSFLGGGAASLIPLTGLGYGSGGAGVEFGFTPSGAGGNGAVVVLEMIVS